MSSGGNTTPVVLVSNRLPIGVSVERGEVRVTMSAGGLATAVSSVHRAQRWQWLGTLGVSDHGAHDAAVKEALRARGLSEIAVPPDEYSDYYEGFANGVLWPLLHYFVDKVQLDSTQSWNAYRSVNDRFARAVAEAAPPGSLVWVHDYQLFLVPERLRALRPDLRIGFFLHVPFPSHELFRVLPWREELLRGVMGADLVGFHTESYGHHFAVTAAEVLGADIDHDELQWDGRSVRVGAFPISIDIERWRRGARTAQTSFARARRGARSSWASIVWTTARGFRDDCSRSSDFCSAILRSHKKRSSFKSRSRRERTSTRTPSIEGRSTRSSVASTGRTGRPIESPFTCSTRGSSSTSCARSIRLRT
jgi:trehalose 6-phosphate synthase/phosphatase